MGLKQLLFPCVLLFFAIQLTYAQSTYWQQAVEYDMNIDFDVKTHQFTGDQTIRYTNNSPDTLHRVFYHLYFNAFQPGSMMDTRSLTIRDSDPRVGDRISKLKPNEIGYQKIDALTQDGQATEYEIVGTILEVDLAEPILPGTTTELKMQFNAQVPVQIRRSGRDNKEGISYSMVQWYPKLAEYDYQGWHATPYVGREFHGVFGTFNVAVTIDKDFLVAGSGYLQNKEEIGGAYNDGKAGTATGDTRTYHFHAPQVHDFMWAADPDYTMTTFTRADGVEMQFFYQAGPATNENWEALPGIMDRAFDYINEHYGQYPYKKYAFIQGGDGGMEYPMGTLITGERPLASLVGVSVHELIHSWYQMVIGINESLYAWMDEGFTSYASDEVMNFLRQEDLIPGQPVDDPHLGEGATYLGFAESGLEEPLSVHADHFITNTAYGVAAYVKGALFLHQLQYIMGEEDFDRGLLRFFDVWKFKHPTPNDFIRVMEKESGLELDWYKEYFVYTTRLPDYGITEVGPGKRKTTKISLSKIGPMPMPVDITISLSDGQEERYTIPLQIMRGAKSMDGDLSFEIAEDWAWTHPTYELELPIALKQITAIEIDASGRMLDTDRSNNRWEPE
ncbi:MAG: M1 family metallopeptidase [Bacteroidota bacterium]